MNKYLNFTALLPLTILAVSCQVDGNSDNNDDGLLLIGSVLHQGESNLVNGVMSSKSTKLLETQEAYQSELSNYSTDATQTVDFSESKILVVDQGTVYSSRHGVHIITFEYESHVKAEVYYYYPDDTCATDQALFNPFKFVEIPTDKNVFINEINSDNTCDTVIDPPIYEEPVQIEIE